MNTTANCSKRAELSFTAYADVTDAVSVTSVLKEAGIAEAQAQGFAKEWRIADHQENTSDGFIATTFESTVDGSIVLAMRGTAGSQLTLGGVVGWGMNVGDVGADGIVLSQAIDLFNYLYRLVARTGEAVVQYVYVTESRDEAGSEVIAAHIKSTTYVARNDGKLGGKTFTVTEHCLGGRLAMLAGRIAPDLVSSLHTYHAPWFDVDSTDVFLGLLRDAGISSPGPNGLMPFVGSRKVRGRDKGPGFQGKAQSS